MPRKPFTGPLAEPIKIERTSAARSIDGLRQAIDKLPALLAHYEVAPLSDGSVNWLLLVLKMAEDLGVPGFRREFMKYGKRSRRPTDVTKKFMLLADVAVYIENHSGCSVEEAIANLIKTKRWKSYANRHRVLANLFYHARTDPQVFELWVKSKTGELHDNSPNE